MTVGMSIEAWDEPAHVQWNHIDGPLLTWRGGLHWLTWRERFAIWRGRATPQSIAEKVWYEERPATQAGEGGA